MQEITADFKHRMRGVWKEAELVDLNTHNNKLATYHSWFAIPCSRNERTPINVSRYLHLYLFKHVMRNISRYFFFLGGVTATAPSRDLTDNKKKRREGSSRGESKRKLLKETQNQRKETRKKKKTQVEYRVEEVQDRRRRRKPGGWKETPNTRKRGGDSNFKVRPFSVCSSDTLLACALASVGQFLRLWFFKEGFSV
jgi:hypothetical protein